MLVLVLAGVACDQRSIPSLATIEQVEPDVLEPGDTLRITGTGFVEGAAKVALIGEFDPVGLAPPRERTVTLDATAASTTWIELPVSDRVIGKLAEEPVDFKGEIEVSFPTSLSIGSVRIVAHSPEVAIEIRPAGGGVETAAKRQREAERFLRRLGLSLAGGEQGDDLQVTAVSPQSPGDRTGIEVGDRLLAVDGTALATVTDLAGVEWNDTYDLELISSQGTMRELTVSSSTAVRLQPDELAAVLLTSLALGLFLAFVAPRRGRQQSVGAERRDPLTRALALAAVVVALLAGPAVAIATRSELVAAGALLGTYVAGVVGTALYGSGRPGRRLIAALIHLLPVPLVMSLPSAFGSSVGLWSAVAAQQGPPLEWHAWYNPFALGSIIAATALLWPAAPESRSSSTLANVASWTAAIAGATAVTAYGLGGWNVPGYSPARVAAEPVLLLSGVMIFALKAWIVVHAGRWFAAAGATERRTGKRRQGTRLAVGGAVVLGATALALLWEWSEIPADLRSAGQLSAAGFCVTLVTAFTMRKLWNVFPRQAS
ncbi:MAG: PDZ domain-containing protein [Deltaproteobacteria bacterium]|nr:PDZ domain-containing protein [Deltaproteobacteria bacterium]